MPILITGGAGFIGSHLAELLLAKGAAVTIIDDLSTGSIVNIGHLKKKSRFRYVIHSMMDPFMLAELMDSCDVVFHLAAAVGVRLIVESPVRTIETNVHGTELLLQLAAKKRKKVLLASTSEVYGKSSKVPYSEDDDLMLGPPTRRRWSYASSKLLDECLALAYHRERNLPVVIVRLFNTVGPRQTGEFGMVLPRMVHQALTAQPLTIYGDGRQTRRFCWVGDVARALVDLSELPAAVGRVFNIGSSEEVTITDLALTIKEVTGSSSSLQYVPYDKVYGADFDDMLRRVPDLTRIREAIGYKTTKGLADIVRAVVAEFTRLETCSHPSYAAAYAESARRVGF